MLAAEIYVLHWIVKPSQELRSEAFNAAIRKNIEMIVNKFTKMGFVFKWDVAVCVVMW